MRLSPNTQRSPSARPPFASRRLAIVGNASLVTIAFAFVAAVTLGLLN